jgi:hypothetical protein
MSLLTLLQQNLAASGSRPWVPTDYANLYAWLKAKSSSDYTLVTGRITAIADKSGLGHGALTTNRNGSSFSATGLDGSNPAFTLVGSNSDGFETNISAGLTKVAYVFWANLNGGTGYQAIFSGYDGTVGWVEDINGGAVEFGTNTNFEFATAGSVVAYNTPQLVILTRDAVVSGGAWEVRVNGTSIASGTYSETPSAPSTHLLGQGGGHAGSNDSRDFLTAAIGEVIVLNDYDSTVIDKVEGYLLWDWGYQSLLPIGHTYKSAAPTVAGGGTTTTLTPGSGSITLTGQAAALTTSLAPGAGSITLAGQTPVLATALAPGSGSITLAGQSPVLATALAPGSGSIALTGQAATVSISANQTLAPGSGSISLSGQTATVTATANNTLAPGSGSITLAGQSPVLATALAPGVGSITLSGQTATVTVSVNVVVAPGTGSIALTGQAAGLTRGLNPGVGSITLTGQAAGLTLGLNPGVGSITISGQGATLRTSYAPGNGTISVNGQAASLRGPPRVIFLTSGTSWTVPANWDSTANTIEMIDGGGAFGEPRRRHVQGRRRRSVPEIRQRLPDPERFDVLRHRQRRRVGLFARRHDFDDRL